MKLAQISNLYKLAQLRTNEGLFNYNAYLL